MTTHTRSPLVTAPAVGTTPTCEARIGIERGAFGFDPVTCRQTVALRTFTDAAGVVHRACPKEGHRASLVRRFGETVAAVEPVEPEWTMPHGIGCPARHGDGDCDEIDHPADATVESEYATYWTSRG